MFQRGGQNCFKAMTQMSGLALSPSCHQPLRSQVRVYPEAGLLPGACPASALTGVDSRWGRHFCDGKGRVGKGSQLGPRSPKAEEGGREVAQVAVLGSYCHFSFLSPDGG